MMAVSKELRYRTITTTGLINKIKESNGKGILIQGNKKSIECQFQSYNLDLIETPNPGLFILKFKQNEWIEKLDRLKDYMSAWIDGKFEIVEHFENYNNFGVIVNFKNNE